ncbi:MAG: tRNA (N(6)-L-threonylcarbamoyladenosine(37)-C(2))-methylthiotransferase MtaB [Negativicutes bacterium]|nr:tRNA (N(6)-L-threonylcarbamoyladenosine(37)-C(2))-methylthiotransferase MtaB [Negativicutes bacterium]
MPLVAFTTLGCKVNQFETEVIEGLFKQRGYEKVSFDRPADVYVINTCSVTHLGERKSRQLIRRAVRTNPAATIVVTGCYAQVAPEQIEAIPGVDVIVGTQDRQNIVDLVEAAADQKRTINAVTDIMVAKEFEDIPLFEAPGRTRAFLKIQEGCTNYCTYCIIPYTRGPLRSRPLASIAREAAKLTAAGFQEIVLTGIHLGAYGRDSQEGITLTDAVKTVLKTEGLLRLRLGSLESVEVSDELIKLMREDTRLCPHLHLPLQSGDDNVLLAMNREYTAAEYRHLVQGIQRQIPGIAITTDVIVGFPGESDEQFANTLAFVETMNFARLHIFPYSKRSGTPAASFAGQVSEEEKKRRVKALEKVADKKSRDFREPFIGTTVQVLFEASDDGVANGYTPNYMHVFSGGNLPAGTLKAVTLKKLHKDGFWGEITN